jgi:hypothetical protein
LNNLSNFATTFFSSSFISSIQDFVRSVGNGGRENWVEGQDGQSLVEPLLAKPFPDAVYALLGRKLALLLLLIRIGRARTRRDRLQLLPAVVIVRLGGG